MTNRLINCRDPRIDPEVGDEFESSTRPYRFIGRVLSITQDEVEIYNRDETRKVDRAKFLQMIKTANVLGRADVNCGTCLFFDPSPHYCRVGFCKWNFNFDMPNHLKIDGYGRQLSIEEGATCLCWRKASKAELEHREASRVL